MIQTFLVLLIVYFFELRAINATAIIKMQTNISKTKKSSQVRFGFLSKLIFKSYSKCFSYITIQTQMFKKINSFKDQDFNAFAPLQNAFQFGHDTFSHHNVQPFDKINHHNTDCAVHKDSLEIVSRSTKTKPGDFEISFESSFLDEHLSAFRQRLKNLMEQYSLKIEKRSGLNGDSYEIFDLKEQAESFNVSNLKLLSHHERKQFKKDLETQENLRLFLNSLTQEVPQEILDQLGYVAYLIWEQYIEIRKENMCQKKILQEGSKFAEYISAQLFVGQMTYLNFKEFDEGIESIEKVEQNFEEFIEFLSCTIFLIIQGYFENPFKANGKRERKFEFSEWEQEVELSSESQLMFGRSIKKIKQI